MWLTIRVVLVFGLVWVPPTFGAQPLRFQEAFEIQGEPMFNVLQDSDGFLWFTSMFSGLVRYDGTNIKIYSASKDELSHNFTTQIFEDSRGLLWIGTNDGLNTYNKDTGTFVRYFHDPKDPEHSIGSNVIFESSAKIVEDHDGNIWIGTDNGLSRYNHRSGTFDTFRHQPGNPNSIAGNNIWTLHLDASRRLWIGSKNSGLTVLDLTDMKFTPVTLLIDGGTEQVKDVYSIVEGSGNYLWIGSRIFGLLRFDKESGLCMPVKRVFPEAPVILSTEVFDLKRTSEGHLIVIPPNTATGFVEFDPSTGKTIQIMSNSELPFSPSGNTVRFYHESRDGIRWVGYTNGKIDKIDAKGFKFDLYHHNPSDPNSLASNMPIPIYEDLNGNIWIGHFGKGLDKFDRRTKTFSHHPHVLNDPRTIPNGYPTGFLETRNGDFYVSTFRGLVRFDRDAMKVLDAITHTTQFYTLIQDPDHDHIVWANGWQAGFNKVNLETGETTLMTHDDLEGDDSRTVTTIRFILDKEDPDRFWIATMGRGLDLFNRTSETFKTYTHDPNDPTSLLSNTVFDVYQDRMNRIWVATDRGISELKKSTKSFIHYADDNRFPSTTVYNIQEDHDGFLWCATNLGLIQFSPTTNRVVTTYTKADGLHSHDFFPTALGKTRDGQLWYGGFKGLNAFYPKQLTTDSVAFPVVLTSLTSQGTPITLDSSVERATSIALPWHSNNLEFGFAALSFRGSENRRYRYFLEGHDRDWYDSGNRNFGRYSELPAGDYILRIQGGNKDGAWSPDEYGATLQIHVASPPWRSPWALLFYVLGGVGMVAFVVKRHGLRLRREHQRLNTLVHERTEELHVAKEVAENANRAKSQFLSMMSHELRTPLNVIMGMTHLSRKQDVGSQQSHYLEQISSSADLLLTIVNDILDLSKIEAGEMNLERIPFCLESIFIRVNDLFYVKARNKGITMIFDIEPALPNDVLGDPLRLTQVLTNLCGNAVKFTEHGEIVLSAVMLARHDSQVKVQFSIADTGVGISPAHLENVFQSFSQGDSSITRRYGGTGLGLSISKRLVEMMGGRIWVDSELSQGSTFSFTVLLDLPVKAGADVQGSVAS